MLVAYYYICKTLWKKNNQLQGTQKSAPESSCQGTQEAKSCTGNSLTVQNCNDLQSDTSSINRLILHTNFIENLRYNKCKWQFDECIETIYEF